MVPMLGEADGITLAGDEIAEDPQPGHASDVTDHDGQLQVHFDERLLHALDVNAGLFDEGVPMAEISSERDDRIAGPETAAQQSDDLQLAQPFAIRDVALASRHVLDVMGIHEPHGESARIQDLEQGNPVDARRFHGDARDPTARQPVRQSDQIARNGLEGLYRLRVVIRRDGHIVLGRSAIDPRGIRVDALQHRRGRATLATTTRAIVFHERLLHTEVEQPGTGRRVARHSPKVSHGRVTARVTNDVAATPWATLANGLIRTSVGSASVPGCSRHPTQPTARCNCPVSDLMSRDRVAWVAGKARRPSIPGVFEGGATPPGGTPRPGVMWHITLPGTRRPTVFSRLRAGARGRCG